MSKQVIRPRTSRSLAVTLSIAFLALSVTVLLIAGGLQMFFNVQIQQETVASRQQLIAQEAASAVAGFIQEKFSKLEAAVKVSSLYLAPRQEQKDALGNLLGLDPALRQVVLLDSQERELVALSRVSQVSVEKLTALVGSALFSQVRQGNRYISPVYVDDVTSEPMVILAVPAQDVFGGFQGTLLAEVNLKFMWDLVDRLQIGKTGLAYVVDRQGNLLAFRDISRVLRGENVRALEEVADFVNSSAPVDETPADVYRGINGNLAVTAYVPLGTPDWAVVIELPLAEAYGPVIRSSVISLLILLIVVTLAGLLGAYLARRLAAPVLALTDVAARIAEGELNLQAHPAGPTEVIRLAGAFNDMTARLRELIAGLQERTRALETSTEVSRRLSTILDREQLVAEVVQQVQNAFHYYHVHIYLIDEATRDLVMVGGTGTAGQMMLASGHRIPWGKGLTGRAAATNAVVLVPDVSQEEGWLPNPLLPETRSEVAVPIAVGERVVGVLDVQHNVVGGLGEGDADLLKSIAGQVAIALQNARLFAEVRQRAEQEALASRIAQQIQSATTVETTLQTAARELGRALRAHRASVQLAPTIGGDRPRQ